MNPNRKLPILQLTIPQLAKAVLSLWMVAFSANNSRAQSESQALDSLRRNYQEAKGSKEIQASAKALGDHFYPQELDSVVKYLSIAIKQFSDEAPGMEEVDLRVRRAAALTYIGAKENANEDLERAREMSFALRDSSQLPTIFNIQGVVRKDLGQHEKAIDALLQGLAIAEALKDTLMVGKLYLNMGVVYNELGDAENSLKNYLAGTAALEQINSLPNLSVAYNNLAATYADQGDYKMAIPYYEKGLALAKQTGDSSAWVYPLVNLGTSLGEIGQVKRGEEALELALAIAKRYHRADLHTISLLAMGELEMKQGKRQMAKERFDQAVQIATKSETSTLLIYAYENLVAFNAESKNYQSAYEWQQELIAVKDSLLSKERIQQSQELQVKYETTKKEAENNRLLLQQERNAAKQRQSNWAMGLGGSVALTIILFLFVNYRRKARHNKELSEKSRLIEEQNALLQSKNDSLKQLDQEKNALMGIVAHDLKAPLAKAGGLLRVLESRNSSLEDRQAVVTRMKQVFSEGQALIEELVLLNELESGKRELVRQETNLDHLAQETLEPYFAIAEEKNIALHLDLPDSKRSIALHAPYFSRILDNLVSNALKFSPAGKQVWIKLAIGSNSLYLEVRDEGPGFQEEEIPQMFEKFSRLSNRPTAGESSTGLGLSIVKGLVDSMEGSIRVNTELGLGTSFEVTIPTA